MNFMNSFFVYCWRILIKTLCEKIDGILTFQLVFNEKIIMSKVFNYNSWNEVKFLNYFIDQIFFNTKPIQWNYKNDEILNIQENMPNNCFKSHFEMFIILTE